MMPIFAYRMPKAEDFMWDQASVIAVSVGAFVAAAIIFSVVSWFVTSRHYRKMAVARGLAEFYLDIDGDVCWRWKSPEMEV